MRHESHDKQKRRMPKQIRTHARAAEHDLCTMARMGCWNGRNTETGKMSRLQAVCNMGEKMNLPDAQTAVVAMMAECGLSRVIICQDAKYNRYSKRGSNVSYSFTDLDELYESHKPAPKMVQKGIFE